MTYQPREGVDAKTRDGNRAVNVLYDIYTNCKCFSAQVNGRLHYYDKNGFLNNPHSHSSVDLVSDWEEAPQWKPIETAPKDGTIVLYWVPLFKRAFVGEYAHGTWQGCNITSNIHDTSPTHWMPLPTPPKVTKP